MVSPNGNRQLEPTAQSLPDNLPAGAKAFQAAVDGKLTQEVWQQILEAQIDKAKKGDRGAAKFLLEYAGGVASIRGATFVQENHHHEHFHEGTNGQQAPRLTDRRVSQEDPPARSPDDWEAGRERRARQTSNVVNG